MRLNKNQLDILGTLFGLIAGISGVLVIQEIGDPKIVCAVGGVATVCLGVITQRPVNESPTTEQAEQKEIQEANEADMSRSALVKNK